MFNQNYNLFYSLHSSVIVNYAKPFSANKPLGSLPKKFSKFKNNSYQITHDEIIELRNKSIAHSDISLRKVYISPKDSPIFLTGMKSNNLTFLVKNTCFNQSKYEIIFELGNTIIKNLYIEAGSLLQEIFGNIDLEPETIELEFDI